MTPSADPVVHYREGGGVLTIADGRAMPIEGIGNVRMSFRSGKNWVQAMLPNVAHVPLKRHNLLSLKRMADRGHRYVGKKKGVIMHLENGKTKFGPSVKKLDYRFTSRRSLDSSNFISCNDCAGKDLVRFACGYHYVSHVPRECTRETPFHSQTALGSF